MPSPGGGAGHAFEMHWRAPAVGEFLEAHFGPHLLACRDVASELRAHRCRLHDPRPSDRGRHCFVALAEPAYGRPLHARLMQTTKLHYDAAARNRPGSNQPARTGAYRHVRTAGDFFGLHRKAPKHARFDPRRRNRGRRAGPPPDPQRGRCGHGP